MVNSTQSQKQRQRLKNNIKDEEALKLRLNGASYVQIASRLNYPSAVSASKGAMRALKRHPVSDEEKEIARRMQNERLDNALIGISGAIKNGNLQAIDRLVALETLRAKLLGTFAPEEKVQTGKIDITEHHDYAALSDEERAARVRELAEAIAARNGIHLLPGNTSGEEAIGSPPADVVTVPYKVLE